MAALVCPAARPDGGDGGRLGRCHQADVEGSSLLFLVSLLTPTQAPRLSQLELSQQETDWVVWSTQPTFSSHRSRGGEFPDQGGSMVGFW